jgi:hypothetical protein
VTCHRCDTSYRVRPSGLCEPHQAEAIVGEIITPGHPRRLFGVWIVPLFIVIVMSVGLPIVVRCADDSPADRR